MSCTQSFTFVPVFRLIFLKLNHQSIHFEDFWISRSFQALHVQDKSQHTGESVLSAIGSEAQSTASRNAVGNFAEVS